MSKKDQTKKRPWRSLKELTGGQLENVSGGRKASGDDEGGIPGVRGTGGGGGRISIND